ncbi:hypothetical protein MRBL20_000060 [Peribacillus frigoritolerans]
MNKLITINKIRCLRKENHCLLQSPLHLYTANCIETNQFWSISSKFRAIMGELGHILVNFSRFYLSNRCLLVSFSHLLVSFTLLLVSLADLLVSFTLLLVSFPLSP